jgi:hypothetical protein
MLLAKLISALEEEIDLLNIERQIDDLLRLKKIHLKILGQSALLLNKEILDKWIITQTRDFDAIIEGDWTNRSLIKRALNKVGLVYDDLSKEVWIPPNSTFVSLYESNQIKLEALDPFFVLLSKAVKAPDKNQELISQALVFYGSRLANAITLAGGKIENFL